MSAGVTPEAAVSLALARVESLDDLARDGTLALDTVVYHGERAVAPWRDGYTMYVSTDKEYAKDYGDVVATPLRSLLGMGIFLGPDEDNVGGDVATDDLSSPAERSRREWYMDYEAGTGKPSLGWWTHNPTNGFTLTGDLASARKVFAPVRTNPARREVDVVLSDAIKTRGSRAIRLTGRSSSSERLAELRERFFDALDAEAGEGQTFYMGPFVVVGDRKGGVLGKLEIHVRTLPSDGRVGVSLSYIAVGTGDRKQGRGTRLMQVVLAAADAAGLPVYLHVSPQKEQGDTKPPMNKKQLRAFYERFGFHTVRGMEADYMERG